MLYNFTSKELLNGLLQRVEAALEALSIPREAFEQTTRDLFRRILHSAENIGGLDSHRALNYLVVQHPGIFLAAAERADRAILDAIETRTTEVASTRRIVSVILTFIDRATGVPERLFTRVDVTEEWPFLSEAPQSGAPPLGLHSFIDNAFPGSPY
jgi:hypothetical protein